MFERKTIAMKHYFVLVFMYIAYIVFSNMSLQYNTVGFYQITKILITPTVLSLEFILRGKRQTIRVCCAIILVCLGVAVATVSEKPACSFSWASILNPAAHNNFTQVSDVNTTLTGVGIAALAVLSCSTYQIFVKKKQEELKASANQLLHEYVPLAA